MAENGERPTVEGVAPAVMHEALDLLASTMIACNRPHGETRVTLHNGLVFVIELTVEEA